METKFLHWSLPPPWISGEDCQPFENYCKYIRIIIIIIIIQKALNVTKTQTSPSTIRTYIQPHKIRRYAHLYKHNKWDEWLTFTSSHTNYLHNVRSNDAQFGLCWGGGDGRGWVHFKDRSVGVPVWTLYSVHYENSFMTINALLSKYHV